MNAKQRILIRAVLLLTLIGTGMVTLLILAFEQTQPTWMSTFGGTGNDWAVDLIAKSSEEFVIIHNRGVMAVSARRIILWNRSLPTHPEKILIRKAVPTINGGILLLGSHSTPQGYDLYLSQLDHQGSVQWERTYGHPEDTWSYVIIDPIGLQTADGGFIVAMYESRHIGSGAWLIRLNATGSPLWNVSHLDYVDYQHVTPHALLQLPDEGLLVTCRDKLLYIDPNGIPLWNRSYGGGLRAIAPASDGGYVLAGYTSAFGAGGNDAWLIHIDINWDVVWNHTYGGPKSEFIYSMIPTKDGGYALVGYTYSFGQGGRDAYLVRTDAAGTLLWHRIYGGVQNDSARAGFQLSDEGFILAGITRSSGAGGSDIWIFKTDKSGYVSPIHQVPYLLEGLTLAAWGLSLGGALVFGIIMADYLKQRPLKS
ncbi:MAG: hypothetical protein ACFFC7_24035 [Candidatus Hermodarchaeota archaeon]